MSCSAGHSIAVSGLSKGFAQYKGEGSRLLSLLFPKLFKPQSEYKAIVNVSFAVEKGSTVGIIGANGSGKSTLLQMICGTLMHDEGEIEVNGKVAALLELGSGFNPEYSGLDNLYLNAMLHGLSIEEIDKKLDEIIAFADIGDFLGKPMKTYSSGMFVRLAFAVAIHVEPEILIIDEALAVGDVRFQAKCFDKLKKLQLGGTTLLFVSHDVHAVRELCNSALWLKNGHLQMFGDVLNVTSSYMQFMFSDENNIDKSSVTELLDEPAGEIEPLVINGIDTTKPINHWGDEMGLVSQCFLIGESGRRQNVFTDDESIEIRMQFALPKQVDLNSFGICFAFRTLEGTDMVVYDTYGQGLKFESGYERVNVSFKLNNPINEGNYMLVAVVEDRAQATPRYFEFIEGIEFFRIVRSVKHFGKCVPPVSCEIFYE